MMVGAWFPLAAFRSVGTILTVRSWPVFSRRVGAGSSSQPARATGSGSAARQHSAEGNHSD